MKSRTLYIVIGLLIAGAVVLGYLYYQERQTTGVEIEFNGGGVSIEAR